MMLQQLSPGGVVVSVVLLVVVLVVVVEFGVVVDVNVVLVVECDVGGVASVEGIVEFVDGLSIVVSSTGGLVVETVVKLGGFVVLEIFSVVVSLEIVVSDC